MKSVFRTTCFSLVLLLAATMAFAQGTTGTLTGTVTNDGAPLPGVTVTISSPNLQGTRTAYTNEGGMYNFGAVPPGPYTVVFNMEGMAPVTRQVQISPAVSSRADAAMVLSSVSEAITVTASAPAVLETTEVQTSIDADLVEELPVGRTLLATTNLAPGVTTTGPRNATTISGGFAYDNLFLVNGVSVGENLRGQPHNLFIEDAIQETTVMTGAVSAEFGNFTGGVVSAITKSGGNEFSGSFRDSLSNDSWTADSDLLTVDPVDKVNHVFEETLGGRIVRDRLWFFLAGRQEERESISTFSRASEALYDNTSYENLRTEDRIEIKLTGQITPRHTLVGSWLDAPTERTNDCQLGCFDILSVDPSVENPNEFLTAHYSGILTNNLLVEAQYSDKTFQFVGYGGDDSDPISGTPIRDFTTNGAVYNAPYFCGLACDPEDRNSDSIAAKLTYYLGTPTMGTHNLTGGIQNYAETRKSNNFQSASNFVFYLNNVTPTRISPTETTITIQEWDAIGYWPVLQSSLGSDLQTNAIFLNDKWDLNSRWSFNVGARYDANDSEDSAGNKVAEDSKVSPRLGAIYDVWGDGRLRFAAGYSQYVSRLAETVAGAGSIAGSPALFYYEYHGPQIGPLPMRQALAEFFSWFNNLGGVNLEDPSILTFVRIPGATTVLQDGGLSSPFVSEMTFGVGHQFGGGGFVRADFVSRDWDDFYQTKRDLETGTVVSNTATGALADKAVIINSNVYDRKYDAVILQAGNRYLNNRLNLGLNYTWSELTGNIEGETGGSGPIADAAYTYPEFLAFEQGNPTGHLLADQTHKVRAWAAYDLPTAIGNFNFSLLQNFNSGTPYSMVGTILTGTASTGIVNPGYALPPTTGTYYFSDRGEFRWDDVTSTDFALNYALPIWKAELFAQAEVLNLLDEDAVVAGDTTIFTRQSTACVQAGGARCLAFNPFTTTPVEGVHYVKGPNFGKPTTPTTFNQQGSFQLPRTYRFSLGLRF